MVDVVPCPHHEPPWKSRRWSDEIERGSEKLPNPHGGVILVSIQLGQDPIWHCEGLQDALGKEWTSTKLPWEFEEEVSDGEKMGPS